MARWPIRRWLVALIGMTLTAVIIGVPTGIIRTSFYHRMTPVLWWNYPVWAVTAVLSGLIIATYVRSGDPSPLPSQMGFAGGFLSLLAVGCPICNKLVVVAIGVTGALNLWAPLQPLIATLSSGFSVGRCPDGSAASECVPSNRRRSSTLQSPDSPLPRGA
ncbi:MAG: hypothetical protein ACR2LE_06840 [Nocardioidaceae bacterium]